MFIELDQLLAQSQDGQRIAIQELSNWFTALAPTDSAFMLGQWNGGVFNTGHPGEAQLTQLRWVGKNFDSAEDVSPIVCQDAQGKRVVSDVLGAARLRMIAAPGESTPTAAMVYDKQPVIDHFKRIDARTVLGVMDRKGDAMPLYFYLRRVQD